MAGKWISAHDLCEKNIGGQTVLPGKLMGWAEHYADGMAAPAKAIPGLIRTFKGALERVTCPGQYAVIRAKVEEAIASLQEQEKEANAKTEEQAEEPKE